MKGECLLRNMVMGVLLLGFLMLPVSGSAESIIEAGVWQVKVSQQLNAQRKSKPVIYQQCIEDLKKMTTVLKPEPNCSVYNVLAKSKEITWDIHCVSNTNSSDGSATMFKSNGGLTGKIEMRVTVPGVSFTMPTSREFSATRISDCKP